MPLISETDDRQTDESHTTDDHYADDRDVYEPSPSAGYATVYRVYGLDTPRGRGGGR